VILLADHDEEGSVGFIINKPLKYTINDLLPEINASLKFIMVDLSDKTISILSTIYQS
jgi:putative AlgH/UPF0301 family transcriptional regulator